MEQNLSNYVARISQATPIDLSIISSEICIEHLNCAINLINDTGTEKNKYNKHISKAKDIVLEKIHSFDRAEKLGRELTEIFFYVNKLIADAQFNYDKEKLNMAKELVEMQMQIFVTAKNNKVGEKENKVINSSEKIIAGLTYSNGKLNEFVDDSSSKTFIC